MHRDWSKSDYLEKKDKYEPVITFEKEVKPVYAWWNGKGKLALLNEPVEEQDGKVRLYDPQGSIMTLMQEFTPSNCIPRSSRSIKQPESLFRSRSAWCLKQAIMMLLSKWARKRTMEKKMWRLSG
jgi:hypothetical protein